jgi:hypothetical protein
MVSIAVACLTHPLPCSAHGLAARPIRENPCNPWQQPLGAPGGRNKPTLLSSA